MQNKIEMIKLLQDKEILEEEYNKLIFGSIEIRKRNGNEYIYVHNRVNKDFLNKMQDKKSYSEKSNNSEREHISKYIGEYSDKLYNLIVNNNIKAKEIKRELREIDKKLKQINYVEEELSPKVEQNIDFAKKHLTEIIYNQSQLEGISTTMANTKNILNGGKVSRMMSNEIVKIINLKHAWDFILNKNIMLGKTDYDLLCQINKILEEGLYYTAGKIRNTIIEIPEGKYNSNIPTEKEIKENIEKILNKNLTDIEKIIEIFLYILKMNVFIDGNENTALIFANQYLISKGKGILIISKENVKEFTELLNDYYNGKSIIKLKMFIKEKCYIQMGK